MLYILTSVWVLCTPNAGRNSHFQHKILKKHQKGTNLLQNSAKKLVKIVGVSEDCDQSDDRVTLVSDFSSKYYTK